MKRDTFAPGKIILSGEYAVVFGYPGIALPIALGIEASFEDDPSRSSVGIKADGPILEYAMRVIKVLENHIEHGGILTIHSNLPFGRGLGSSTALVVSITRALCGENARAIAESVEKEFNPDASGIDFETIWGNGSIVFKKGAPFLPSPLALDTLRGALLIDTGLPNESTAELVAWMQTRKAEIDPYLQKIASCTERILNNEPLPVVLRDHHAAQVALGVVPPLVEKLISDIETVGGAAKAVGAGARTGGAGMVLALGPSQEIRSIATRANMPVIEL